eukprot:3160795-Alexandrium_andersonii.AAC.1
MGPGSSRPAASTFCGPNLARSRPQPAKAAHCAAVQRRQCARRALPALGASCSPAGPLPQRSGPSP